MFGILGILLVVGALLLIAGMEGKTEGDAPRCVRCFYNLTGLTSDRCPECGSTVSNDTVVWGLRRRNRPLLITAVVLLIFASGGGASLFLGEMKGVNWYRYHSTERLIRGARAGRAPAVTELHRRINNGLLSPEDAGALVTVALDEYGAETNSRSTIVWADILALCNASDQLSEAQQKQFYGRMAPLLLSARRLVRMDEFIPAQIEFIDRGSPSTPYLMYVTVEDMMLDGQELAFGGSPWGIVELDGQGRYSPWGFPIFTPRTGTLTLDCRVRESIFAPNADPFRSKPLWTKVSQLTREVVVLPADEPDPVRLISEPTMVNSLNRLITVERAEAKCGGLFIWRHCDLTLYLYLRHDVSIDLAFEVSVLISDEEHELGSVCWAQGDFGWAYVHGALEVDEMPSRVRPILRGSRNAAAGTVGCFDVWDGELRLRPVQVIKE